MSLRAVFQRGYQRGIQLLKIIRSKNNQEIRTYAQSSALSKTYQSTQTQPWTRNSVSFLNSVWTVWLKSCRETWVAHLRRQASLNFMARGYNGRRNIPLLAFVGVAMVSNSGVGIITNHDEMKAICEQIRMSMSVVQTNQAEKSDTDFTAGEMLESFEIGNVIAKGCNAVVYSAKINKDKPTVPKESTFESDAKNEKIKTEGNFSEYPLAIKMMFNYDAESYAPVILRAMYRETLPAKRIVLSDDPLSVWGSPQFKSILVSHPNIVDMKYVFADQIPVLPEQLNLYPHALPARLFPDGCGRNMTLFLVMKRYHKTLKEYLNSHCPSPSVSLMLLSQILEGVHYLRQKGICHRDLKADNILLDLSEGPCMPRLVITDFGCCTTKLSIPFPNCELDQREGNVAMMAPEVSCACPGSFTYIDYRKADLWAVGALAYEIYGCENPFYTSKKKPGKKLDSRVYRKEDLPPLSDNVTPAIKSLIFNLLSREPSERMSASMAANVCQILRFAPWHWFLYTKEVPSDETVTKWLVLEAASSHSVPNHKVVDTMKITFLKRVKLDEVINAIRFISSCY